MSRVLARRGTATEGHRLHGRGVAVVAGEVKRNRAIALPLGRAAKRVKSQGLPRNRRWTGSTRRPEGSQRDHVAAGCHVWSGIIPRPRRSKNKSARTPPRGPELARVRGQGLRLPWAQSGSSRGPAGHAATGQAWMGRILQRERAGVKPIPRAAAIRASATASHGHRDKHRGHADRHQRWARLERAALVARSGERPAQGVSPRPAAKGLDVPRRTRQAWRAYQDRLAACPAVGAFLGIWEQWNRKPV
jgi:hypothetical protein